MDVFDLCAKITLDTGEYEDALDDAAKKTDEAGEDAEKSTSSHGEKIKSILSGVGKVAAGFHLGNAVKYICRAGRKEDNSEIQDLSKAVWYIQRYIDLLKEEE